MKEKIRVMFIILILSCLTGCASLAIQETASGTPTKATAQEEEIQSTTAISEQMTEQEKALAAYEDFVESYAKQWENPDKNGTPGFALIYLDNDDIPELAIYDGEVTAVCGVNIYTYEQGEIVYIGEYGYYGCMYYLEKEGIVYEEYGHGVNACCSVHQIDGTTDTLLQSFSKWLEYTDGTETIIYTYMIDDKKVSEEQYEDVRLRWSADNKKVIDNGMYTSMINENIQKAMVEEIQAPKAISAQVYEQAEVLEAYEEFLSDYAEYLNNLDFYRGIYIDDINGDEIPEMIIDINELGSYQILYHTENGLAELELETVSAWGYVIWIADTKQFLFCPFYGHTTGTWGYIEYYIYDWTGTEYEQTLSLFRESGYYVDEDNNYYGRCYINGEETDAASFETMLEEIEVLKQENNLLSKAFPIVSIDDENFEAYVKENLPCFQDNYYRED